MFIEITTTEFGNGYNSKRCININAIKYLREPNSHDSHQGCTIVLYGVKDQSCYFFNDICINFNNF